MNNKSVVSLSIKPNSGFFTKFQLPFFFLLAYLLSWWTVPVANGGLFPYGPALAAIIVLAITIGRQGLGELWSRIKHWHVAWYWYVVGPSIFLASQGVALLIMPLLGRSVAELPHLPTLGTILQLLLLGGMWEEIGWSGYALPKIQERFADRANGPLIAALILGAFRAIWHLPLFLSGKVFWFDLLIYEFTFQLLIAWVLSRSGGSVLVVMLLHLSSNIVGAIFSPVFTGAARTYYYALFMALETLIVLVIIWRSRITPSKKSIEQLSIGSLPQE